MQLDRKPIFNNSELLQGSPADSACFTPQPTPPPESNPTRVATALLLPKVVDHLR